MNQEEAEAISTLAGTTKALMTLAFLFSDLLLVLCNGGMWTKEDAREFIRQSLSLESDPAAHAMCSIILDSIERPGRQSTRARFSIISGGKSVAADGPLPAPPDDAA